MNIEERHKFEKEFIVTVPYHLAGHIEHAIDFICNMNIGVDNMCIKQVKQEKISAYYAHLKITLRGTNEDMMNKVYNTILAEDKVTLIDKL